jgi:hypothetical protein
MTRADRRNLGDSERTAPIVCNRPSRCALQVGLPMRR